MLLIVAAMFFAGNLIPEFSFAQSLGGESIWTFGSDKDIKHLAVADLNGDNIPDVMGGEFNPDYYGEISFVYAVDGATGLELWSYQLDDGVRSMTAGDINGDGIDDVIAGASYHSAETPDGQVHAIDGTTGLPLWTFPLNATIASVSLGDFDGDELMDVAVACWDDYIYAVDGQTGTQMWATLIGSIFINDVACGDVNDDKIDDIAYAHEYLAGYTNYIGVLDGTDGSTIWQQTVAYVTIDVLMADIDNDGLNEAVFGAAYGDDHAEVHVRDGLTGALEWSYNMGSMDHVNGQIILQAMDIDGDFDLDLTVGNVYNIFNLVVFEGNSNIPMWISENLSGFPRDVAVADVTGDAALDIVVATYDRVQVLDAATGSKIYYYAVAGNIGQVEIGDFDGDSVPDIAAGGGAEYIGWPPNPGKSIWAIRTTDSPLLWDYTFGEYGNDLVLAYLDDDEYEDAVAVCSVDDQAIAISGLDGSELWRWTGTQNLYAVTAGDFDNDGQNDVAVAGNDDMVTAINGSDGQTLWQFTNTTDQTYRKCLKSADLTGDGAIDVIAGADNNYVYAINGPDGGELWSTNCGGQITDVKLVDFNGIPPIDVAAGVGGGVGNQKIVVLDGSDGSIIWTYNYPSAVEHIAIGDVNDDAVPDFAAAMPNIDQVQMIDGSTQLVLWTAPVDLASNTQSIASGDLDGDKTPDILVMGTSTDSHIHAINGLTGTELWTYPTGGEVNCVHIGDIDGDDIAEALAGSDDQNLYIIDGPTGALEWNYSAADDIMQLRVGNIGGDGRPTIACVTFGSDGLVYAFRSRAPFISYTCGDFDDNGIINILDIVYLIDYKFTGGPAPEPIESADVNNDGVVNLLDIVYLIDFKFQGGPEPNCP